MRLIQVVDKIRENKVTNFIFLPISKLCSFLKKEYTKRNPMYFASHSHKMFYGRKFDFSNPRTLHEKIYWMLYHTDVSLWGELTDKVAVRDYIKKVGYGAILNEVYKVYDNLPNEEELFSNLPNSYVMKTNHCGGAMGVYLVRDAQTVDRKKIYKGLKNALAYDYGTLSGQPHYQTIKPKVVVEKLLVDDAHPGQALFDYKFFCFHGKPVIINFLGNRGSDGHAKLDVVYNTSWEKIHWDKNDHCLEDAPKPQSFDEMLKIVSDLSKPFPFVRVDLYEINGKPVFGEMTFTPGYDLFCGTYGDKVLKLGDLIDLSKVEVKHK